MKEKHEKMRLNASGHQSENERQLKKIQLQRTETYTAFPPQFVF